jgi:D-amino-acid dehydrogenase
MRIVIIGGGIIGLSSALYLHKAGHEVIVIDKTDLTNNCSYGNAGYICPSHFIPLSTPGIAWQGLKWMFDATSPFYIEPRLDWKLIKWGWHFLRSANLKKVNEAAAPLRDIALLSQQEYVSWTSLPGFQFGYQHRGLLEIFQTEEKALHAQHTLEKAHELGLTDTKLLIKKELEAMEPAVSINALGALYFGCDAHCYPNQLMKSLLLYLKEQGVSIITNRQVTSFHIDNKRILGVSHEGGFVKTDEVVIATGSWGRETAALLGIHIPMMPGRGYSVTSTFDKPLLNYPAILVEGRVAVTPLETHILRFGGTMEITSHQSVPRLNRVKGIIKAVKSFYPSLDVVMPPAEDIWYGYRPCSADGLPFIGRVEPYKNLVVATGHSMLGLSLGAGTGKLVKELINRESSSMDIHPFRVARF